MPIKVMINDVTSLRSEMVDVYIQQKSRSSLYENKGSGKCRMQMVQENINIYFQFLRNSIFDSTV